MSVSEIKSWLVEVKNEYFRMHPAGYAILKESAIWLLIINGILYFLQLDNVRFSVVNILSILLFIFELIYYRKPLRLVDFGEVVLLSPIDGKVVYIKDIEEHTYFNSMGKQITINVSPLDAHIVYAPFDGVVGFTQYAPAKKFSMRPFTLPTSEMYSVALVSDEGYTVLIKLSGLAFAGSILGTAENGKKYKAGSELGFLKFGRRAHIIVAPDMLLHMKVGDKLVANKSVLAAFNSIH